MHKPEKICERVYLVGGPEITDPRDCCIYLVDGGGELALIDAGLGFSCAEIINNIERLGLDKSLLKYVIATHGHIDHIGGLSHFKDLGIKVACHELEINAISHGSPELTAASYYGVQYKPVSVDIILRGELQELAVGDLTLHCLFTPGHTPGGVSPYVDTEGIRVLFGQDIHGPFDSSWGSDLKKWKVSMLSLLDLKADVLCEGHYGIYQPAGEVKRYIETYLRRYAR